MQQTMHSGCVDLIPVHMQCKTKPDIENELKNHADLLWGAAHGADSLRILLNIESACHCSRRITAHQICSSKTHEYSNWPSHTQSADDASNWPILPCNLVVKCGEGVGYLLFLCIPLDVPHVQDALCANNRTRNVAPLDLEKPEEICIVPCHWAFLYCVYVVEDVLSCEISDHGLVVAPNLENAGEWTN